MTHSEIITLKSIVAAIPVPDVTESPLSEYAGYAITRNKDTVEFGCGAVRVQKSDLTNAIEFIELTVKVAELTKLKAKLTSKKASYTASFKALTKQYQNYNSFVTPTYVKSIGVTTLKRILG